ncbi:LPS-assembly protein LptD, partial [Acinetobacter baumannii]|uniref:LPS-assembly protein LptD n=1 Tax=Acinetobacter baumannii TaxID=470 RepID=UPI00144AB5A5
AQDLASEPAPAAAPEAASDAPVGFEADEVRYDSNSELVTAVGNVILRQENQSARADTVTWNRDSGQIVATGNVKLVDEDGNQLFTEKAELTDKLRAGAMENLLLALREGGRLAAVRGTRADNGTIALTRA